VLLKGACKAFEGRGGWIWRSDSQCWSSHCTGLPVVKGTEAASFFITSCYHCQWEPKLTAANLSTLVLPVAVVGAAGYGYLWWKGLSLGDVMYVTWKSMLNAVSSVSKQLENVSAHSLPQRNI